MESKGCRLHGVEKRAHALTFEWRQLNAALPRVGFVVQHQHRIGTDGRDEELVAFA
jgi:hypothetical protein